MKQIKFTDNSIIYFDPIHVKFYNQNKEIIQFNINTKRIDDDCSKFQNQVVLMHRHKNTKFSDPRNIRILLGHACNFRCKYCQQHHSQKENITDKMINNLQEKILKLDLSRLDSVQYWGGEPLLYWDEIKKFHKFFKKINPNIGTCIVTNGSLMNHDICNYVLGDKNFAIILSHDGPGQFLRGIDPLRKGSESLECFLELYNKKNTDKSFENNYTQNFAVNPVLTKETKDLKTLINYYNNIFNGPIVIAESIPVIPTDPESKKFAFEDLPGYSEMLFNNLKELGMVQFNNFKTQYDLFTSKLQIPNFEISPTKAQCFTTDPRMLVIDIDGNILPCQTFQAFEKLENGDSCNCGNINDMSKINMPEIHGIGYHKECKNCLVASFCMGGCPYLINQDTHGMDCKFKYAHFYGLFKFYLYFLMGKEIKNVNEI